MADIGRNIKKLRLQKGLSQEELGEKLSVTRQTISNYETGRSLPDIGTLERLAQIFGTNIEEVIYGRQPNSQRLDNILTLKLMAAAAAACFLGFLLQKREMLLYVERYYYISGRLLVALFFYPLAFYLLGAALGNLIFPLIKKAKQKVFTTLFIGSHIPLGIYLAVLIPLWAAEIWGRVQVWLGVAELPSNALIGAADPDSYTLIQTAFIYILNILIFKYNKFFLFAIPGMLLMLWWQSRKATLGGRK